MQPLGTKKSRKLSGQNKTTKPQENKIKQPFGTKKKSTQPLTKKVHATKKNASYRDKKKVMPPLGTKQITQPPGTNKNNATSYDNFFGYL